MINKLIDKRILLISPEPWEGLHMSKHHISQELARRGNHVFFLDPPAGRSGIRICRQGDIQVIKYGHWFRGINRLPRTLHMWYYESLLKKFAERAGGSFDIIWCFDMSRMQWFPEGYGYKLLYLADYDILYSGKGLIETADVIFTTSQVVKDHLKDLATVPVINVGHALDQRWLKDIDRSRSRHIDRPKTAFYAGQLATPYHDWEGFVECAFRHPEIQFVFIGPYDDSLKEPAYHRLKSMQNVQFKGLMTKDDLIPFVRSADILFFGFRSGKHAKERANPHKILEYLSTGNVTVGSWTMEYESQPDLFRMAKAGASLADEFDRALIDFQHLNSPLQRSKRIDHAMSRSLNSLLQQVDRNILNEK